MLIATKFDLFSTHAETFRAQENSPGSRETAPPRPQLLHRAIHTIHSAPVDITVDKGTPPNSKKPQQNQHFKSHTPVPSLYPNANTPLIANPNPNSPAPAPSSSIVTPKWNMHRSGAACSLNVTSIGICLSSQHCVFTAISLFSAHFAPPPLTPPECRTIVKRPLECSRPTSQGFFRGFHESA
jgi:hypothetical protein